MPTDVVKPRTKPNTKSGGSGGSKTAPVIGIVKDNIDPTRSGRIKVLIADKGIPTNSDDSGNWVTVSYLPNFFGSIIPTAGNTGTGDYTSNPSSYGEWHAPPDIGTKVVCIFINGDQNFGFYIGCIPDPESLQMIPAIGSSDNIVTNEGESKGYGGATRLPVTNINTNDKKTAGSEKFLDTARPVHSYTASIMNQQGIIRDPIRGPISSSASREPASRVGWGVSTPGRPIYDGGYDDATLAKNVKDAKPEQLKVIARRGGHSFVMDDGDVIGRDQLIRIRTALGHQILMSDDGQTLMILHSNGQSYIELGKEGTIDMYSTNSVNIRTQGDLNLHADQNVNIHAMENLNLQGKNIQINSEEDTKIRAGKDIKAFSIGNLLGKAGGSLALASGGEASMVAGGVAYVNGSKVNLNSGGPGVSPVEVPVIPIIAQTDTLYDQEKGFMAAPAKLLTITSRAPAHAPWANAGQGVNVKTTLDASASLPASPAPAVAQTTAAAVATNSTPPAVATVASTPPTTSTSTTMGKGTTAAAASAVATTTSTGPAAAAPVQGAAVVPAISGAGAGGSSDAADSSTCAVGSFGLTPTQMVDSGVLKPGADTLVNGLLSTVKQVSSIVGAVAGAVNAIEQAMPSSLFTAAPGASNLSSFVKDVGSQTQSLVTSMQKAQTALTKVGVINGNESSGVTAGLVTASATVGLKSTVDAVKQVAGVASSTLNSVSGVASGIVGSGAGQAINQAASAINTVSNAAAAVSGAANAIAGASDAINNATGALGSAASAVGGAASAISGAAGGVTNAIKAIGSGAAAAGFADKLGGLGGISNALSSMKKPGGPLGLSDIEDLAKGVAGNAFGAIKDSFKPLKAGVPQNLTAIAKEAAAKAQAEAGQLSQLSSTLTSAASGLANSLAGVGAAAASVSGQLSNAVSGVTGALSGASSAISGAASSLGNAAGEISGALSGATSAISSATSTLSSVAGSVSSVAKAASSVTSTISSLNNSVAGISGAVGAATSSLSSLTNSISGTVGSISNAIGSAAGAANSATSIISSANSTLSSVSNIAGSISSTANKITNAVNNVSSLAGAGPALASGGTNTLATAASTLAEGAAAASSSQVASGISNLAGGIKSVSSVLDKAEGALNKIPGTNELNGLINDAQASVMNGLSSVDKIASDIGGQLNNLTSLVSSGLPAGAAAELASAVSALSAGGAAAIKLPAIGFNTTDRTSITSQIKSVLGNPKIPMPNLVGEITSEVKGDLEKIQEINKKVSELVDKVQAQDEKINAAINAYFDAEQSLPAGDPKLDQLREAWKKLEEDPEYINWQKQIEDTSLSLLSDVASTGDSVAAGLTAATGALSAGTDSLATVGDAISGLSSSFNSSLTDFTNTANGATAGLDSITAAAKNSLGSINSAVNSVSSAADASLSSVSTNAGTALSSVAGQGATAIEQLQTSINTSEVELNNSITGITGPVSFT